MVAEEAHCTRQPVGRTQVSTTLLVCDHWARYRRVHPFRGARGGEDLGSIPVVSINSKLWLLLSAADGDMDEGAVLGDDRP